MNHDAPVTVPAITANNAAWPVRPLTRTRRDSGVPYTREKSAQAQIAELCALTDRMRRARLVAACERGGSWTGENYLCEETLVYFVREYHARGDHQTAWLLTQTLSDRTAAHIVRKLARWRLSETEADDCARDLFEQMCSALRDTSAAAEFWEVRFWVCLDRRLWNLVEKRQATTDAEQRDADEPETPGGETGESVLSRLADPGAGPQAQAEWGDALRVLDAKERDALYLVYIAGLPEESDDPDRQTAARIMGVTGRSVRNYLRRGKAKLEQWEKGSGT